MRKMIFCIFFISVQFCYSQWVEVGHDISQYYKHIYIFSLAVHNNKIFAGTTSGVFFTTDNGETWEDSRAGLIGTVIKSVIVDNDVIFTLVTGVPYGGYMYLSTNDGESWKYITPNGGANYLEAKAYIVAMAINKGKIIAISDSMTADSNLIAYISENNGENWTEIQTDLPHIGFSDMEFSGNNIFAGTSHYVYMSRDNGIHWIQKDTSYGCPTVISLQVDSNRIFAGTKCGLFLSTDEGNSWKNLNIDTTNHTIEAIAINWDTIFVGTYGGGFYISTDNGDNWRNTGLTNYDIFSIAIKGEYVFAGGNVVAFRAKISDLINGVDVKEEATQLHRPLYPNPTRDYINTAAYLGWQYQIYDLIGSCMQSGMIETENINVTSLPTGFYTIRFFNEGKQVIEKLIKE